MGNNSGAKLTGLTESLNIGFLICKMDRIVEPRCERSGRLSADPGRCSARVPRAVSALVGVVRLGPVAPPLGALGLVT